MANLRVKIYSHEKREDDKWTYRPRNVDFDSRTTKTEPGNFRVSWSMSWTVGRGPIEGIPMITASHRRR